MDIVGYLAYVSTFVITLVFSYWYLILFGEKDNIDANLKRQLTAQGQLVIVQTLNTLFSPLVVLWTSTNRYAQLLVQNWKYLLLSVILISLCVLMHYEHQDMMPALDQLWRCLGHTAFYDFFMPLLQTIRAVYGFLIPTYNLIVVTFYQLWQGTLLILFKCQVDTIFTPLAHVVTGVIQLLNSVFEFVGADAPVSSTNNIAINDFNIEPAVTSFVSALNSTQVGMRCACEALDPAWDIVYAPVTSPHLAKGVDHTWNMIIRFIQLFLRIVVPPNEVPNIETFTYHMYGAMLEFAFFIDHIIYTTIINLVRIFSVTLFDEATLKTPKEFIFSSLVRMSLPLIQVPLNLFTALMKLFTPNTLGNSAAMMNAFNMDDVWANLHIALYDLSNTLHWLIYLVENIASSVASGLSKPKALPTEFHCDWARDVYHNAWPEAPHTISYTTACTVHNVGLLYIGVPMLLTELFKELFFKSIVLQEQNVWRVLQKYDGMWSSRDEVNNCEARQRRATPLNGTHRLDWTIRNTSCRCDMRLGEYVAPDPNFYPPPEGYRYASEPVYNPWCGQPTLQDQIFAPMDASLIYITRGIFGPSGFGEVLQYSKIPGISFFFNMRGKSVDITLPSLPPVTRVAIEVMRITARLILSLPDIVTNHWVYNDINCGYGLNSTQLDERYMILNNIVYTNETYMQNGVELDRFPTSDEVLRFQPCSLRRFKFPGIPYNKSYDMKTCETTNEDPSCSCNFMLNLTVDSPCGCIAKVPELATIMDDNPLSKFIAYQKVTSASYRWCNSNFLEWLFFMEEQMLDSITYMLTFAPWNNDCTPPRQVTANTDMSSYYVMASTTTTDIETTKELDLLKNNCNLKVSDMFTEDDRNEALKEYLGSHCVETDAGLLQAATATGTCKLWANHNLFCSLGDAWRRSGEWTVNLQRQIASNVLQVFGLNFNKFDLDARYRICDLEKAFAAQMSVFTNIITLGLSRGPLKKSIGKVGLAFFEYSQMFNLKLYNNVAQFILGFIDEIKQVVTQQVKSGLDFKKGFSTHVKQLVKSSINIYMDIVILLFDALGDFCDALQANSGEFFRGITSVLKMLVEALSGTFLEIVGTLLDLVAEMVAFFAQKGDLQSFLSKFFAFTFDIVAVVVQNLQRVLSAIFMLLGPAVGGFLNSLMSGVCEAINAVVRIFNGGSNIMTCISGGFGSTIGSLYASKHGQDLPRLFAEHYETVDGIPATKWVAEHITWNGTSKCDLFMEGVRHYNYTELRPLERAQWLECLEMRAIGQSLAKVIDIPELELYDLLYNYHRKWVLAYDMTQTFGIVTQIYLRHGSVSSSKLRATLIELNIQPDGPVQVYEGTSRLLEYVWTELRTEDLLDDLLKLFDPDYADVGRPTRTARLYQSGLSIHHSASEIYDFWEKEDMTKKGARLFSIVDNMKEKEWIKKSFTSPTHILGMGHTFKSVFKQVGHHVRLKRRATPLKKPLNIDIKYPDPDSLLCPNPQSALCVKCTLLDNLLETVVDWTKADTRFLINVYSPNEQAPDIHTGVVQPGTIPDIKIYFERLMTNNSGFIDDTQRLTRKHRNFNPLSSTSELFANLTVTQRFKFVSNDWNYMFGNFTNHFIYGHSDTQWHEQVPNIVQGFKGVVSSVNNSYVPFFGYGAPYVVTYVFTESCDAKTAVWNEGTSQSQRLKNMEDAFLFCLVFTLVLVFNGVWSTLPLGFIVNTIVLLHLNMLLFFYIVYGYMPSCLPTLPHMLLEDFTEYVQQKIAPGCFCDSWPTLTSAWCNPSTCYQCGIAAGRYTNCLDKLPLAKELGVWWIVPIMLRWLAPWSISWLAETGFINSTPSSVRQLVVESFTLPADTSSLEIECALVTAGDIFINAAVGFSIGYLVFNFALSLIQFILDVVVLLWQVFILFEWTALAVEQSTRVAKDEEL